MKVTATHYHLDLNKMDAVKKLHANEALLTVLQVEELIDALVSSGDVAELDHKLKKETSYGLWLWTQGCARFSGANYQHIWVFDCLARFGLAPDGFDVIQD